jgi:hypothetical protein
MLRSEATQPSHLIGARRKSHRGDEIQGAPLQKMQRTHFARAYDRSGSRAEVRSCWSTTGKHLPVNTAIRAAAMLASRCGCEAFDFVVLAADAIEQLAAILHATKVSRPKWSSGKAIVVGAGPSCQRGPTE